MRHPKDCGPKERYPNGIRQLVTPAHARADTSASVRNLIPFWKSPRSAFCQKRKCPGSRGTSVLPSGAEIISLPRHVRLVPKGDMRELRHLILHGLN